MSRRTLVLLVVATLVIAPFLADLAESRGRGGRGGGGFSRGGGGFGRAGAGGGFGSIRNSSRPSSWDRHGSYQRDLPRPQTGAVTRPTYGQRPDQRPRQQPDFGQDRPVGAARPGQLPSDGGSARPEQRPSGGRDAARQPLRDLTPEQKDELRQKFENSGLAPSQLPSRDRDRIRDDWEDNREDWQDWRDDARDDWQKWYANMYDEYWDDHWYPIWWYGYPVSTVSFSFYIDDTPPCQTTVVVNQVTGTTTYYYCNSIWYQSAFAAGEPRYVVSSPPAGAELTALSDPYLVTVGRQGYFVSNHVFYQKITRDGETRYVTVDAPVGAIVPTIPEYAVAVEYQEKTYFRFDRTFYLESGDSFVVVPNPGV